MRVSVGVRISAQEPISAPVCVRVCGFVYTAVAHSDVHAHIKDEANY